MWLLLLAATLRTIAAANCSLTQPEDVRLAAALDLATAGCGTVVYTTLAYGPGTRLPHPGTRLAEIAREGSLLHRRRRRGVRGIARGALRRAAVARRDRGRRVRPARLARSQAPAIVIFPERSVPRVRRLEAAAAAHAFFVGRCNAPGCGLCRVPPPVYGSSHAANALSL